MSQSVRFYELLELERERSKVNSVSMDKKKYELLIRKVISLKMKSHKDGNDYRFLKRYDIIEENGVTKLVSPVSKQESMIKYFVYDEELFELLDDAHIITGHGGRDRMVKHLKSKYKNITYKDILIFLSLCDPCLQKQKCQKKGIIVKPPLFKELIRRCQVDIINFESHTDDDYKFILVYQDLHTKFVILRALKSKSTSEVCEHIIDIFTLLGAPSVLLSDNGREFVDQIISKLVDIWPNFKIVHGKTRRNETEEKVRSVNQDIEDMLIAWMTDHNSSRWAYGLKFVQLLSNSEIRSDMKKSSYEAMFGCPLQHGLATSGIPTDVLSNIESEEDLEEVIREISDSGEHDANQNQLGDEQRLNGIKRYGHLLEQENTIGRDWALLL